MTEYNKIETVFVRDESTKKLNENVFRNPVVEYLKDNKWRFTEKIDGTNIRVVWDGHKVSFYGRTDRANIPSHLVNKLNELFGGEVNEEMFEQVFGENQAILFGEGYGYKIQNGGNYIKDGVNFILFDVMVEDLYLRRDGVEDIARSFGIDVVPVILEGTIQQAVDYVKSKPKSTIGTADSEGLVGVPCCDVYDRRGKRVIVKVKVRDFE